MSDLSKISQSPPLLSYLFAVRVWQEDLAEEQNEWRGSVELVGSGKKVYFRELSQIGKIIAVALGGSFRLTNSSEGENL